LRNSHLDILVPTYFEQTISKYAKYLVEKIKFHHTYPAFEGNFSLDTFINKHSTQSSSNIFGNNVTCESALSLITLLLLFIKDLQPLILRDQISSCNLVAIVREAHCLFLAITFSIKLIVHLQAQPSQINQLLNYYNTVFPLLHQFYANASKFVDPGLIPILPTSIPTFGPNSNNRIQSAPSLLPIMLQKLKSQTSSIASNPFDTPGTDPFAVSQPITSLLAFTPQQQQPSVTSHKRSVSENPDLFSFLNSEDWQKNTAQGHAQAHRKTLSNV